MKVEIEEINNGYIAKYDDGTTYVYRSVDDIYMWSVIAEKLLKRKFKIEEK